ncbi:MAG: glycoside hydrolase family 5 protein [Clostridiales bacterium]|nr:glycoside hydrolase family 5 protein [Clostridiales bacterium]
MSMYEHFKKGINLGGWLSQYDVNEPHKFSREEMEEHFRTFITEKDIEKIASWGADHVRLPFIAKVVEEDTAHGTVCEKYITYLDQCIDWCEKNGLSILLDLHELEGHGFLPNNQVPPVLKDADIIARCVFIWKTLAERYKNRKTPVIVFELLNEVHDPEAYYWRSLYKLLVKEIRSIDQDRIILVGTNEANSPFRFDELEILEDPNIVYNFHFYDPFVFTHQLARFSEEQLAYNRKVHYPGEIPGFIDFLKEHPQWIERYTHTEWDDKIDKETMAKYLKGVFDFQKHTGREVYCGEYGVVDSADRSDACAWLRDFHDFLKEHKIGRAYWNYKEMDFGVVDKKGKLYSEELLQAVFS